ncbi:MAG: branched-chain amino acid ABC transporter permease [Deltaproteobacteria bacterium]|nr:branched-chain amino acid ABC transporter permease [Deltaproteobacteria bacterium]
MELTWNLIVTQILFGLALGAVYILMACGLTIIFGLLDVVNFAHGTFYMLGAFAAFVTISLFGNFWLGLAFSIIIVGLIGWITESYLIKPLYGKDPLYPLMLTFGFSVAVTDLMRAIFGTIGKIIPLPKIFAGSLMWEGIFLPKYRVFIIFLTLAVLIFLWYFLKRTNLGMIIRAATRDSLMVRTLGINVPRIWTFGFALGVGLAGLAGGVNSTILPALPDMGVEMTIECFVVVVIGGLGSLGGAILGGLIIGQVISFVSLLASDWSNVAIFLTMLCILLVRTRGLFGEAGRL